jgi:hypothetical protein
MITVVFHIVKFILCSIRGDLSAKSTPKHRTEFLIISVALSHNPFYEVSIKAHLQKGTMKIKLHLTLLLFASTAWAGPYEDAESAMIAKTTLLRCSCSTNSSAGWRAWRR